MIDQQTARTRVSGARYKDFKKKKKIHMGRLPGLTKVGATKKQNIRVRGGSIKFRLLEAEMANVYNPKTKKYEKVKIKTVLENPANRHYVRRNIMTKGSIIETEKGKAKITSRPGQEGVVNAVFV